MNTFPKNSMPFLCLAGLLATACFSPVARAQEDIPSKVPVHWNRYYDFVESTAIVEKIAEAYPELVTLEKIGTSLGGRDMVLAIVNDPSTGPHESKPAMWIDGNIHGNEIQATEVVLYTLWYLTKCHGKNEQITELLRDKVFYLLPSVNPDGRQNWFDAPNTSSSSRGNIRPKDSDRDGLVDEDGPDDLDGDGSITRMWKLDPDGTYKRDKKDPRVFQRIAEDEEVPAAERWKSLGREGIDDDGDGRVNEDGPGSDDMNRSFPGDWQPEYIQRGAGPYPLYHPETRAIGEWFVTHPNIAGAQSYHNTGGMILRGPGTDYLASLYDRRDNAVYDSIAQVGEDLLPYYRDMVLYRDLYNVHGGEVTWFAENLGICSFTNELWARGKYFQREETNTPADERMQLFYDRLQFGATFTPYTEVDHPQHGKVLVGGMNKWVSRTTPTFMLEEECHRNFAFTALHADQMPKLSFGDIDVERSGEMWEVTVEIENERKIPTRMSISRTRGIGVNDLLSLSPGADSDAAVLGASSLRTRTDERFTLVENEPDRIQVAGGVPGEGSILYRFFVSGSEGAALTIRYQAEKALDLEKTIDLTPKKESR